MFGDIKCSDYILHTFSTPSMSAIVRLSLKVFFHSTRVTFWNIYIASATTGQWLNMGATTSSLMTLSLKALNLTICECDTQHINTQHNGSQQEVQLCCVSLGLSIEKKPITPRVVMLSVTEPSVAAPKSIFKCRINLSDVKKINLHMEIVQIPIYKSKQ